MEADEFVKWLYPYAKKIEKEGGVSAIFTVAQAALESGWGKNAIGNNLFGITIGSDWKGDKKLVKTTEYFSSPNVKFKTGEKIVYIQKINDKKYKYTVYRYFRDYASVENCLKDHQKILEKPAYSDAWPYRSDPDEFARRIVDSVKGKYATTPDYYQTMKKMNMSVKRRVDKFNL